MNHIKFTRHLLDFKFLKGTEAACSRLHMQRPSDAVLDTLFFVCAIVEWGECLGRDFLERFGTADIAGIRVHLEQRFDLGDACHDAAHSYQVSNVCTPNLANSHGNIAREGLEIQVAKGIMRQSTKQVVHHALSSKYVVREPSLIHDLVPFASLVHNNVDDLVMNADVFCRGSVFHNVVYCFAE